MAPPKPPRPLAPEQQAENTLKEAFPSIDAAVVKAVLRASGGRVEPAFNALLGEYFLCDVYCEKSSSQCDQACRIQMQQSLFHQRNPQGHHEPQQVQLLQRKISLQRTNDMRGSSLSTTMVPMLTVRLRGLRWGKEGAQHPVGLHEDRVPQGQRTSMMIVTVASLTVCVLSGKKSSR